MFSDNKPQKVSFNFGKLLSFLACPDESRLDNHLAVGEKRGESGGGAAWPRASDLWGLRQKPV